MEKLVTGIDARALSMNGFQGRELEKKHGKLGLWNGDSSRLHVRKAQYK